MRWLSWCEKHHLKILILLAGYLLGHILHISIIMDLSELLLTLTK